MDRMCGSCSNYCDGFCDLKGYLVEEDDLACKKYHADYISKEERTNEKRT